MQLSITQFAAVAAFFGMATAAPAEDSYSAGLAKRAQFNCNNLAFGLNKGDCEHMAKIGMAGQGANDRNNNGKIWIGTQGPNTFKFTNRADKPSAAGVILIVWNNPPNDYQSSFMNVRKPQVSYSLPKPGDSVTISLPNGVSGGWSTLVNHQTTLSQYGQVFNTWGEFTTGNFATVDVSREINMGGNTMSIKTNNGCVSDMGRCVFKCKKGNSCGERDTYVLENCAKGSQPGATYGTLNGQPEGGCQGWSNGGHLEVSLGRN